MTISQPNLFNSSENLPHTPAWVIGSRPEAPEDVAFLSGAVLCQLHLVVQSNLIPNRLLGDRMAIVTAEAAMKRIGRPERAAELRDEVHLARSGDHLGPGGQECTEWRRFFRTRCSAQRSGDVPMVAGRKALERGLSEMNGRVSAALMAADSALAESLGWTYPLPLFSLSLGSRDVQLRGDALQFACGKAAITSGLKILETARELARRAERLRSVAPKLRAKGAGAALDVFLTQDAVSPTVALSPIIRGTSLRMSERAARRLCDRLVHLGVVREMTGRETFRLYGL